MYLELDLDVDTGGEVELHQRVHGLRGRIDDIDQALVSTDLELLTRLLVDVRRTVDRKLLDLRGQRDRTRTRAPVRLAVLTISLVDWSSTRWSNARSRIRIF